MKIKFAAIFAALALCVASTAWAGTITFDFSNCSSITSVHSACPGDIGTSTATYTSSGLTVTASGFSSTGTTSPNNLFVKNAANGNSGDELGLGLAGQPDNEVNPGQYIYLNLSDLLSHGIDTGTLWVGSVQAGEAGKVCATSAAGTPGSMTCFALSPTGTAGIDSATITWSSGDPFVDVTATEGNILVGQKLEVTSPVPEPSSLFLFGTMLLALAFVYRRFGTSKASC